MRTLLYLTFAVILSFYYSCARYTTIYGDKDVVDEPVVKPDNDSIDYRIYLIGDTGFGEPGEQSSPVKLLQEQLQQAPERSIVLFLGDNAGKHGIPSKKSNKRDNAEARIKPVLEAVKDFKGKLYFIPGDKDWNDGGPEAIERQEDLVQDYLDRGDTFIPDDGCGGPETEELSDRLVLITINSAWFLSDWDNYPVINKDCDQRTRSLMKTELKDEIKKYYRTHNVIIATHHPVVSNGPHAGFYGVKSHLLPLPVLGSVISFLKGKIGTRQDMIHPLYQEYSDVLDDFKRDYPGLIFVSAHENSLSYFRKKDQHYIVSGAGSKATPVRDKNEVIFSHGGLGMAKLDILKSGSVWLEFWKADDKKGPAKLLLSQRIKPPFAPLDSLMPPEFPEYKQGADSIRTSIIPKDRLQHFSPTLWGSLNTDLFKMDVKFPVLYLDEYKGGLTPFRRGGGFQTNSVRLKDPDGNLYQLRSLRKDASRLLPYPFNKTFATKVAEQQLTAGNPFGALVLAPLSESINIYYPHSEIYYVPKQPALGRFNDLGGELYLFEERPDEDWSSLASYGNSKKIISDYKMIEERMENNKAIVDQKWAIRTRLFDYIIGDWDRHNDQWRWAEIDIDSSDFTLYRPIPRDRDQVFSKYGGILPNLMRQTFPFLRATQSFDYKMKDRNIKWMNRQPREFDRFFLNELVWEDWEEAVNFIQKNMTDEVIENAIRLLPPEVYDTGMGAELTAKLKSRRDDLMHYAREYYKILYKEVHVVGTHKENLFEVQRIDNEHTEVRIYEYRDKKTAKDIIYQRTFDHNITKEIALYGLDDDDDFEIKGKVKDGLLLRLVGGNGEDKYTDESSVRGLSKKTQIYDNPHENKINGNSETRKFISNFQERNSYTFQGYNYDYGIPLPFAEFNPDDGFKAGLIFLYNHFGFKQSSTHTLNFSYAFSTGGYSFSYTGDYKNIFGRNDFYLKALFQAPQFVLNYYGMGNETVDPEMGRNFHRIRQERIGIYPSFKRRMGSDNIYLKTGPLYERIRVEDTPDRIITSETIEVDPSIFDYKNFGGWQLGFHHSNVDRSTFPTRGMRFSANVAGRVNLADTDERIGNLEGSVTFYHSPDRDGRLVIASRIGGGHAIGDYSFYQAVTLGGNSNLRGYGAERFTGGTSFYHNTDLRFKMFKVRSLGLPFSIGITAGFDYGRVWVEDESSVLWHTAYGGHIWFAPLDYFALSGGIFRSEEGNRFSFQLGFHF